MMMLMAAAAATATAAVVVVVVIMMVVVSSVFVGVKIWLLPVLGSLRAEELHPEVPRYFQK